jgi:hypothetical protein
MSNFTFPTEFKINSIELNGEDALGVFVSVEIYESIYLGGVTGSVTIFDTDAVKFIEKNEIEFIEEISLSFSNASGEDMEFEGFMNGLRNETVKEQKKMYTIDFSSKAVRKNEMTFLTKPYKNEKPESIASEIAEVLETEVDSKGSGEGLTFLGSRKKPLDIMRYVMSHGVTTKSSVTNGEEVEQESKGTSGFMFWETLDGYRFCSSDDLLKGSYETWSDYKVQVSKRSLSMDESMKGIIDYEFPQIGNFQSKLRSGAFKSVYLVFDMDKGEYKEIEYEADSESVTEKQKSEVDKPTRYFLRMFTNEKFSSECSKTPDDQDDQSKKYLQQNTSRQNTLADQHGRFVLPPSYKMRAGDIIDVKIPRVSSDGGPSQSDNKHSGKYLIKQVAHFMFAVSQ